MSMIIEQMAEKLVEQQVERPMAVLAVVGLATLLVVPGMLQVDVKPSTEAILPGDDSVVSSLDALRAKHAGDTTYIVVHAPDVRTHETLEAMHRVAERIEMAENVRSVRSPADVAHARYGEIPRDRELLQRLDYGSLVSPEYGTAVIAARADTQADTAEIRNLHDTIETAVAAEMPGRDVQLTGYNMIDLATFRVIISDFMRITGVSFLAVLGVLYLVFRDPKRMLFPIVPVMFALVWMLGLGGWFGADLTIISMVSAAMILGLGIDFGIHVTKKYFSTVGGKDGLSQTMVELSRGLLGGSLTTGVGFLALLAATLTGMHALGIFLFSGILSAYIGAVVVLPALLMLDHRRQISIQET